MRIFAYYYLLILPVFDKTSLKIKTFLSLLVLLSEYLIALKNLKSHFHIKDQ